MEPNVVKRKGVVLELVNMSRPDPVSIRLPDDLKETLQTVAKGKGRSLNNEIMLRLKWSIGRFEEAASDATLANEVESLRALVRALESRLGTAEEALVPDFTLGQRIKALEAEVDKLKKRRDGGQS